MLDDSVVPWARTPWPGGPVLGSAAAHRDMDALTAGLDALPGAPIDRGAVYTVVCRESDQQRTVPDRVHLCPARGVVGDRWIHGRAQPEMQVAVMRVDVAHLISGGQHPAMFGDNLLVDLDLSVDNLPIGTHLMVGDARCVVSTEPHTACAQFAGRFGMAALRLTAEENGKRQRLRGVYLTVIEAGEVCRDSSISVVSRPEH